MIIPPNKHFGTLVRTMARFFRPLWSEKLSAKSFSDRKFPEEQKVIKVRCQNRHCAWLGSNLPSAWRFFFLLFWCLNIYFLLFINPPKKSRDDVKRNPKNPSFQNNCFIVWVPFSSSVFFSHFGEKWEFSPRKNR